MKVLLFVCVMLAGVLADECPDKLLQIATKNIKSYLKGVYKKVGNVKLNCTYDHDINIFNLEHHVVAETTFKNRKLSFELKTHSSMFDLYNFTDFNGNICHSKMKGLKESKDRKLIRKSFVKNYVSSVTDKDLTRFERKGMVCYKAKLAKDEKKINISLI